MGINDTTEDGVDLQDDRKGLSIAEKSKEEPIEMNNGFESAQIMDVNTEKLQGAQNGENETCLIKVEEPEELVVLVCESQSEKKLKNMTIKMLIRRQWMRTSPPFLSPLHSTIKTRFFTRCSQL